MSLEESLNKLADAINKQTEALVSISGSVEKPAKSIAAEAPKEEAAEEKTEEKPAAKKKAAPKKKAAAKKPEDNPDYVRMADALNKGIAAKKQDELVAILGEYGVKRATEAPEDKWGEIADKFEALTAEEAEEEASEGDLI